LILDFGFWTLHWHCIRPGPNCIAIGGMLSRPFHNHLRAAAKWCAPAKSRIKNPKSKIPRRLGWLAAAAGAALLLAMWIIPCRMLWGQYGSFYTFAYVYDEVAYADLIQPLLPGTSPANPFNGFGDTRVLSQHFMEDLLRFCAAALRLDAIEFFWLWRFLFPLCLFSACYFLSREALRSAKRLGRTYLALAAACAGAALMACEPLLFRGSFPPAGWIERTPTNLEFPVAIVLAGLYLRALRRPTMLNWAVLSCVFAFLVYVRIFGAILWGLAICCGAVVLLFRRELARSVALVAGGSLLLCLAPWLAIYWHNSRLEAQAQLAKRLFPGTGLAVHWRWWLYLTLAALCAFAARFLNRRDRIFAASGACALLAAPFLSGVLPFGWQLLALDRFSSCYWPLTMAMVFLVLERESGKWTGTRGWRSLCRWHSGLAAGALLLALLVACRGATLDLLQTPWPTYRCLVREGSCLRAYKWIAENTAPEALFLVDDGQYWADRQLGSSPDPLPTWFIGENDLFSLVAQRQRVFTWRLIVHRVSDEEYMTLELLHCATFGYPVSEAAYSGLLKRYHPQYIFWRKTNRALRSPPPLLLRMREIVYDDAYCEIWALKN